MQNRFQSIQKALQQQADKNRRLLHLLTLSAFALAQPVFDLLSKNTPFFTTKGAQPFDIFAFALLLLILPASIVAWLCAIIKRLSPSLSEKIFLFGLGFFILLIFLPVLKNFVPDGLPYLDAFISLAIAAIGIRLYTRLPNLRSFLTLLTPVILIFPLIFLVFSPVRKIVFPKKALPAMPVVEAKIPVVLVVLDEFPVTSLMNAKHQIDAAHFPNFAELSRQATWYINATTVSDRTAYAVPVIFSGLYPDRFRAPNFKGYPRNLFTLLGRSYHLNVSEAITTLCPPNLCKQKYQRFDSRMESMFRDVSLVYLHMISPQVLAEMLPPIPQDWEHFWNPAEAPTLRTDQFRRFLKGMNRQPKSLHALHVELPHGPWAYLPDGTLYTQNLTGDADYGLKRKSDKDAPNSWVTPWIALQQYQRHLMQVQYTDRLIGEMLRKLKELGIYENALIIVTADHGVSFRPDTPGREITESNFMDVMPVPLLIKYPGQQQGKIEAAPVQSVDILPTIADVLGVRDYWEFDGASVYHAPLRRSKIVIYNRHQKMFSFSPQDLEKKYESLSYKTRHFTSPTDLKTESFGLPSDKFGKAYPAGLRLTTIPEKNLQWSNQDSLSSVEPNGNSLPAMLMGRVSVQDPTQEQQAFSLVLFMNNRLVSFTQTEPIEKQSARFAFLIQKRFFKAGNNPVKVYRLQAP